MSDSIDENMIDQLLESINENNYMITEKEKKKLLNNYNDNIENNLHTKLIKIFNNNREIIINSLIFLFINLIFINKTDYIYLIIKTLIIFCILYIKKFI